MRIRKQLQLVLVVLTLIEGMAFGQGSTHHVFPQVVDGRQTDGSYYTSILIVTNLSGLSSTCSFNTVGLPVARFSQLPTQTIPSGSTFVNISLGQGPILSGYGDLACAQPVQASLIYGLSNSNDVTLGMATVPSATLGSYASFPVISGAGLRFGFAIANPSSSTISVNLLLNLQNGTQNGRTIQIAPRSQFVRFVDELVTVPGTSGLNIFEISSVSQFYVTGLMFDGAVFTTLIPSTLP